MLTWGLIVLIVNLLYILFAFIVSKVAKHFLIKYYRHIGKVVFVIVLLAPFWDLFIQKGIKTYYQVFDVGTAIYAYPEKDKDGKIESLGIGRSVSEEHSGYLHNQQELTRFKKFYAVKDYFEFYFFGTFEEVVDKNGKVTIKDNYKKNLGYARVYLDENPIRYEKLQDESEYKARYQVKGSNDNGFFYEKNIIEFWDMKEHKLLAKALKMDFYTKTYDQKFRNKYLLWKGANGIAFSLKRLESSGDIYKIFLVRK
jgi:hypothetical protein